MKRWLAVLTVTAALAVPLAAQEAAMADHVFVGAADVAWGAPPPALPPGSKIAVLKGDPGAEGLYVLRAWMPAGYRVMPHWHPNGENVTVVSGEIHLGMGDTFSQTGGELASAGSYVYLAPGAHHYVWTDTEVVIQVHGMGPFALYYLNPEDDPRNQAPAP